MPNLYTSPNACLEVPLQKHVPEGRTLDGHPYGERQRALRAYFGTSGAEQPVYNPLTGQMDTAAEIIGGYFDLDAAADSAEPPWTPEERQTAKRELDRICKQRPDLVRRVEYATPAAERPWPTYDLQAEEGILEACELLGLAHQALSYEAENQARPELLEALRHLATTQEIPDTPGATRVEGPEFAGMTLGPVPPSVAIANKRSEGVRDEGKFEL